MFPEGFSFATAAAGFRKAGRDDLGLVVSDVPAHAAAMFTQNVFKAAPVLVAQAAMQKKTTVRAVLVNAGQANACTGEQGLANCHSTLCMVAQATGLQADDILPASTGVIGTQFDMQRWEQAVPALAQSLGHKTADDFSRAIMTTDAFPKLARRECPLAGGTVHLLGIAKGGGMICPNMATMIATVLCDAALDGAQWQGLFAPAVAASFNRVTVDGDTSTNDTIFGLANGCSGVRVQNDELPVLQEVLTSLLAELAAMLVRDGEGATKVIHIHVTGARSDAQAEQVARTVGHSPLVKTAMYGRDANWGRIVAAIGRSGADFAAKDVRVAMCGVELFRNEQPVDTDFDTLLKEPLASGNVSIEIELGAGSGQYILLTSDLTHDYVTCNGSYRS